MTNHYIEVIINLAYEIKELEGQVEHLEGALEDKGKIISELEKRLEIESIDDLLESGVKGGGLAEQG